MVPDQSKRPPQAPPTFTGTKESIVNDAKELCDYTRIRLVKMVASVQPEDATFKSVLQPGAADENEASLIARILVFYQHVSDDAALRDASAEANRLMDEFSIECNMREDVFRLVDAVYARQKDDPALDKESARLLDKERKSYIKNGLALPAGTERDRLKEIKKRLSQIQFQFQKNLNEENGGLWITPAQLEGVPEDIIDELEKGSGENEGKLRLTFKYPDLLATLKFAINPETRRKVFIENENKSNANVPLFKEAMVLRDEAARLLGYPDHATMRLQDEIARDPETVNTFLNSLRQQLSTSRRMELEHLLQLKKADYRGRMLDFDDNYYLWDHWFYDRLMIEKEYNVDENKIAEYFPLQNTVTGMLNIFEALFGLKFIELTPEDREELSPTGKGKDIIWHEDVIMFSVWDDATAGFGFVGYLYLDLYRRPGKCGYAANFNLQPGFRMCNGGRRYPVTALICNFRKPTPNKPSLLKHDEVVMLFHKLGHSVHDLAGRCRYSRFHGMSTARNFVEVPSQMFENWCWMPSVLRPLSAHWETGAKIPDELIEKLIATKHVNAALFNLRRLHIGLFDIAVHSPQSHADTSAADYSQLYNELRLKVSGIRGPEAEGEKNPDWSHGEATFGHLVGEYDAGYYGYLSSEAYSTDIFYSVFRADPMNEKEGRRYRHTVLERGGSQDEMLTLEQFLGRKPSIKAFYEELGLAKA